MKYDIGYTTGVFDLFHVGHLNILLKAKSHCKHLIVGVTTDELVAYKNTKALIPFHDRLEIIRSLECVDEVVPQVSMDKYNAWEIHQFNAIFVGDDWKGTDQWNAYEKEFNTVDVDVLYFKYTSSISSSILRDKIINYCDYYS